MTAAVAVMLVGCHTQSLRVSTSELRKNAPALARGEARVAVIDGGVTTVSGDTRVEVYLRAEDAPDLLRPRKLRLRELVGGCATGAACLLDRVADPTVLVGTRTRRNTKRLGRAASFVAGVGVLTFCLFECDTVPLAIGGGVAVLGFLSLALLGND